MKKAIIALAAASLALGGGTALAESPNVSEGESKLAEMLAGYVVAGEPQSCIPARVSRRLEVIDETALVYDAGNTLYVARPKDPESLDESDILVIDRFGTQLCASDVIRTVDRYSGFMTGVVFLSDFVPYRKG